MADEPRVVSFHKNIERELITIEQVESGRFKGEHILVVHDDPSWAGGSDARAPMLLDEGTRRWLREELEKLDG